MDAKPAPKKKATKAPINVAEKSRTTSLLGLANLLGKDRSVIVRWIKQEGLPVIREGSRGTGNEYEIDLRAVFSWWGEKNRREAEALSTAPAADDDIDRKTKLLKFAAAAGLVAPVDYTEQVLERTFGELRQTLMSISARVSRSMSGMPKDKIDAWCEQVDQIVRDALQAAADSIEESKIAPPEHVTFENFDADSSE